MIQNLRITIQPKHQKTSNFDQASEMIGYNWLRNATTPSSCIRKIFLDVTNAFSSRLKMDSIVNRMPLLVDLLRFSTGNRANTITPKTCSFEKITYFSRRLNSAGYSSCLSSDNCTNIFHTGLIACSLSWLQCWATDEATSSFLIYSASIFVKILIISRHIICNISLYC